MEKKIKSHKDYKAIKMVKKPTLEENVAEILKLLRAQDEANKQIAPYNIPYVPFTPMPDWPPLPQIPNIQGGWKCPSCGMIIYPNQTHFCSSGSGPFCGGSAN